MQTSHSLSKYLNSPTVNHYTATKLLAVIITNTYGNSLGPLKLGCWCTQSERLNRGYNTIRLLHYLPRLSKMPHTGQREMPSDSRI
jgi:hypothetical protein